MKRWFAVLCWLIFILLVTSLIILYYRIKLRALMLTQTVRNKIASDLHDDIGSTLSSISFLSEIARQKAIHQPEESAGYFNQIGESSRDMIQTINDIVWSVNPQNDTFGNLTSRMRKFASSILEAKNIRFEFEASASFEDRKMNMLQRRTLYLMFKEIINNTAKHAHCSTVQVKLEVLKEKNKLTVTDNGKGFDVLLNYEGNGLKNLRKRSTELQSELIIDSAIGKGTSFTIIF
jgi:signal transduction histidine kinase